MHTRNAFAVGVVVAILFGAGVEPTSAQQSRGASSLSALELSACYLPSTGLMYMVGLPGLPSECRSPEHVKLRFTGMTVDEEVEESVTPKPTTAAVVGEPTASGDHLPPGTITTPDLANGAVTSLKILNGTIAAADLAVGAVTSSRINNGAVSTADLADGAVTSGKIADGSIQTGDIATRSITASRIRYGAVNENHIADGAVTGDKLAAGLADPAWSLAGNAGTMGGHFIGTTDAQPLSFRVDDEERLRIVPGGGTVLEGTFAQGAIPATGAGTRMMWYPGKAAFRAGAVDGSQWDDASIGEYSTALGQNTMASGERSTALGAETEASGDHATALGLGSSASGVFSTAMGYSTTASGDHSTAMGQNTTASGDYATAMGQNTTASGNYATAMGQNTTASQGSTAMGVSTTASASSSTAMGDNTTADAFRSTAMGSYASTNSNPGAFVYGDGSTTDVFNAVAANEFAVRATGGVRLVTEGAPLSVPDGGTLFGGTVGQGSIPAEGPGARLMWYPGKAALRAGGVDGTQWDDGNLGDYSTAIGWSGTASGWGSTVVGPRSVASGITSMALGFMTTASGQTSTAMGAGSVASGSHSLAAGWYASTNGHRGSFVYADYSGFATPFEAEAPNEFAVRATGGVRLETNGAGLEVDGVVVASVPSGAVMNFDLGSCPAGWSVYDNAVGRAVVGRTSNVGSYWGNELVNQETHDHSWASITANNNWYDGRDTQIVNWSGGIGDEGSGEFPVSVSGSPSSTITFYTSSVRTDDIMPYVQLLPCKKN